MSSQAMVVNIRGMDNLEQVLGASPVVRTSEDMGGIARHFVLLSPKLGEEILGQALAPTSFSVIRLFEPAHVSEREACK